MTTKNHFSPSVSLFSQKVTFFLVDGKTESEDEKGEETDVTSSGSTQSDQHQRSKCRGTGGGGRLRRCGRCRPFNLPHEHTKSRQWPFSFLFS